MTNGKINMCDQLISPPLVISSSTLTANSAPVKYYLFGKIIKSNGYTQTELGDAD